MISFIDYFIYAMLLICLFSIFVIIDSSFKLKKLDKNFKELEFKKK